MLIMYLLRPGTQNRFCTPESPGELKQNQCPCLAPGLLAASGGLGGQPSQRFSVVLLCFGSLLLGAGTAGSE